jgi:hypothetical protein
MTWGRYQTRQWSLEWVREVVRVLLRLEVEVG